MSRDLAPMDKKLDFVLLEKMSDLVLMVKPFSPFLATVHLHLIKDKPIRITTMNFFAIISRHRGLYEI